MDGGFEALEAGLEIRAEMNTQGAASALGQDLNVTPRLGCLDDTEGVGLSGDGEVHGIVARDLKEDAGVSSPFVGLAGGVQEPRAEADTGGNVLGVANFRANRCKNGFVLGIHLDVAEQGEVVAGSEAR